jgi:hypothetical protein
VVSGRGTVAFVLVALAVQEAVQVGVPAEIKFVGALPNGRADRLTRLLFQFAPIDRKRASFCAGPFPFEG